MHQFREILYSNSTEKADFLFNKAINSAISKKYPKYVEYLCNRWLRKETWCMSYRQMCELRGHNTNNYSEITVRLFKDHVLCRCKAYNVVALIDFIATAMEKFYISRL